VDNKFNGIIDVIQNKKTKELNISHLEIYRDEKSCNLLGTKKSNDIECRKYTKACYIQGYLGSDNFIISNMNNRHIGSTIIRDFNQ